MISRAPVPGSSLLEALGICRLRVATVLIAIGMLGCENPQPPMSCGAIPQQTVTVGQTGTVSACFNDPNGDLLTYVAVSSNPGVAAASAVDWAADNGVDVLSMSFSMNPSVSVIAALSYAYNNDDVLLLAALGNESGHSDGLVESSWVMGVGGVSDDTNRTFHVNLQHWEIGGYSGGRSPVADCPNPPNQICGIGSYSTLGASQGGTSSATANVAAIATLIRAASPSLTNVQVRNRLKNTAYGRVYRLADAEWAVENVSSVGGTISGPTDITSEGTYSWQVTAAGGLGDYTYSWHKRTGNGSWRSIGSTSQISLWVAEGSSSFELRATVGSHGRERWVFRTVSVCWDEDDDDCEQ